MRSSIISVGVNDRQIDLFEGQYKVPSGMSYNSYAIIDEKIAIMDSVDKGFGEEWIDNIRRALGDRDPDYLVVLHMEPDHSANIMRFADEFPSAKIVSSAKAFSMMKNFFGRDFAADGVTVSEGDELPLGEHTLRFILAPMVHWPEVILAYETREKVLFSADAFGKFGALDADEGWDDEARRYYIGIVGKYGAQVTAVLKKAAALDISAIYPLHGPILSENLSHYLGLYSKWASYTPEEEGTVIAYTSVYGNTRAAAMLLSEELAKRSSEPVSVFDLARCDMAEAVASAFRYSKLVLATTTYNADVFPFMREFISHLTERGFKRRKVAFIENGSWAPMAEKIMRARLSECKELDFAENSVKILSALDERAISEIKALAEELTPLQDK